MSDLIVSSSVNSIVVSESDDKNVRSRVRKYRQWLDSTDRNYLQVDMMSYRDYLLGTLRPSSVAVHLSTIRKWYKSLIRDNRNMFYTFVPDDLPMSDRKAYVDEMIEQIHNAIQPETAPVRVIKIQDQRDDSKIWLEPQDVKQLMSLPDRNSLTGQRDLAIMALLLATGCREGELANAQVGHLRVMFGDEVSFFIPEGKGRKQRLVPYGEMVWMVDIVESWLESARIYEGYVFRRIYKGDKRVGNTKLSGFGIQKILRKYPIMLNSELTVVKPHDYRRTYARSSYFAGMEVYQIQLNMGHSDENTTKGYIGNLGASKRRPPAIYEDLEDWIGDDR